MQIHLQISALLTASLLTVGCVLPVPHRRMHAEGMEARVVDANTHSPVHGAKVSCLDGSMTHTSSDSNGAFEIAPHYGWHGAYLVGPISYSLFPHFDMTSPSPPIRIDANGYHTKIVQPFDDLKTDSKTGHATIHLLPK